MRGIDESEIPVCNVVETIINIKVKKPSGEDGISNRQLNELPDESVKYIANIANSVFGLQ